MSWLTDLLPGGDREDSAAGDAPPGRGLVERVLQLCEGTASAAAALDGSRELGRRGRELAGRLRERLAPLKEAVDASLPGTIATSQGVHVPGRRGSGGAEAGDLPLERLREAEELLGRLHFDLLRAEVHGRDPAELELEAQMDRLESFLAAADELPEPGSGSGPAE